MMTEFTEVTCDRCGYQRRLAARFRQYRRPDRRAITVQQTLAWCRGCRRAVEAETLPDAPATDEVREWLLGRQSPPRCLECGSTAIEAFPQDEDGCPHSVPHPGCGGVLRFDYGLQDDVQWRPLPYSLEGDPLTELLTECEWGSWEDPDEMLLHLEVGGRASPRKLRLFACACCRRIWEALSQGAWRRAVETTESYAEGEVNERVRQEAARAAGPAYTQPASWKMYSSQAARHAAEESPWGAAFCAASNAALAALWYAEPEPPPLSGLGTSEKQAVVWTGERRSQCDLLRDLFGPLPFRPIPLDPRVFAWGGGWVREMAQAIYEERAFDRLPILADALYDAGCTSSEVLEHCREQAAEHVRGCWVLDLLLGRG